MAKKKTKIVFGKVGVSHVTSKHVAKKGKKSSRKRVAVKA